MSILHWGNDTEPTQQLRSWKLHKLFLHMITHISSCPAFLFPCLPSCLQGGSDAGHEWIAAVPCLCSSPCPLGWSPSRLLPVTVVSVFLLRGLQSLWLLFLGISGWFQPSRHCQALGWQPPGDVWEMSLAQFKHFLVASVNSVLWNILFNKMLHRVAVFFYSADTFITWDCYSGFTWRSLWWHPRTMKTKLVINRSGNNTYHHSSFLAPSCITGCFYSIQQQQKILNNS